MKAGIAGGIETAVKAINTHINNVNICKQGCGALWSIILNNGKNTNKSKVKAKMKWTAENQVKAGTSGGIEAVVKAINTHIRNAGVCENGCGAFVSITKGNGKSTDQNNRQQMTKSNEQLRTK